MRLRHPPRSNHQRIRIRSVVAWTRAGTVLNGDVLVGDFQISNGSAPGYETGRVRLDSSIL